MSVLSRLSTASIQNEITRRSKVVLSLGKQRDGLMSRVAKIEAQIERMGGPAHAIISPVHPRAGKKRPKNKTTLPVALLEVLHNSKLPMSVTELTDAVQKHGYVSHSKTFRTIVNQALLNPENGFQKVSRGQYTALKKGPRPKDRILDGAHRAGRGAHVIVAGKKKKRKARDRDTKMSAFDLAYEKNGQGL